MYLKRLTLQGFKSFADRTEFEFVRGRTSIVGPNGCGKSNVLDAVRWVLGEQSARTLRGSKMLDVIFAGSRSRLAAPFAEVELTFDNSAGFLATDEGEVSVGRLLYRSGDSEYRINGKSCRLKDVKDLFLDTGVGVDAYSVIEQGKVDALLAANPLERREIFEEAAGISRYKVRRTEAQRKLERTQNNLLRLNDVLEELEKRLRSVKLAAGKARNFQEYDTRLRELRAAFSLAEFHELQLAGREQQARHQALSDVLLARRTDLAQRDADAAELDRELQALDELIQTAEAELAALQNESSALVERAAQGRRRLADLCATRERQTAYVEETGRRAAELESRISEEGQTLAALLEAEQREAGRVSAIQSTRDEAGQKLSTVRRGLEAEKTAVFDAARQATLLANEHHNLDQQRQRLEAQAVALFERRSQLEHQVQELETRRVQLESRAGLLDAASQDLAAEIRALETQISELEAAAREAQQEVAAGKEARSAILSRLQVLQDLESRYEGVDQGTRWALGWREDAGAAGTVLGLVAEVLRIDDPRLALIQAVLSRFENHVLVRSGYEFLAELQRRGEPPGPVCVIALDRVDAAAAPVRYDESPGFVAHALDWVRCDEALRPLAQRLLGRTVIVDVLERALALADGAPDGYVFVTLDGQTVESGGRITLGVAKGVVGLISRKTEIRNLRSELDEVEVQIEQGTRRKSQIEQQAADTRLQREEALRRTASTQREHAETRTELARLGDEQARVTRETDAIAGETAHLHRALDELSGRVEKTDRERQAAEQSQRGHESRIAEIESDLSQAESELSRLTQEVAAAQVEAGRSAERRTAREHSLAELRSRLDALRRERLQVEEEAIQAGERIAVAEQEIEQAATRQTELATVCEQREAQVLGQREQRQALRRRIEASGAAVRLLHSEIEEVDAAVRECEVSLRETDVRKENLTARVREELELDLVELHRAYEHAERDWEAIKQEIEELRGKIARLGHVNLDAIAELEELQPRYDNLVTQRADLDDSIKRLEALIGELDAESQSRFASAFEEIRGHFQELFRKLFGGGKADIVLENPEQPLECGIEIIARPPGKEPQTLSLLSGGEKTLTAVAMLFAVFRSRPSPFAILDEVDAALDEANVGRFNNMVDEFVEQSQFIVITHHKRTMQAASMLYGVTMEEPGVSKRVSVRFDDRVSTPNVA